MGALVVMAWAAGPAWSEPIVVNSNVDTTTGSDCADSGLASPPPCTLPQAIELGNQDEQNETGPDDIAFSNSGPIVITTPLPEIDNANGYGIEFVNGFYDSQGDRMELEGSGLPDGTAGLRLEGPIGVTGFSITGVTNGVDIEPPGGAELFGDYIGLLPEASSPVSGWGNTGDGVEVESGAANNCLPEPGDGANEIDDNEGYGIVLEPGSGPTTISDGFIGLGSDGMTADANGAGGIDVQSDDNQIGAGFTCEGAPGSSSLWVSGNVGPGITLAQGTSGNAIEGVDVGVNALTPMAATPNTGDGIDDAGSDDTIGQPSGDGADVVSGNADNGIVLSGTGDTVSGDFVGTDSAGLLALGNGGAGVLVDGSAASAGDTIDGSVISANTGPGLSLQQPGVTAQADTIGVGADRSTPLSNGVAGVSVDRGPQLIGGTGAASDLIEDNDGPGVQVTGTPTGVTIRSNSITGNRGLGIAFAGDPVSAPVLSSVSAQSGNVAFEGSVNEAPDTQYQFDLYAQPACGADGPEGAQQVAGGYLNTNSSGVGYFGYQGTGGYEPGDVLTATVTDPSGTTSEFSDCATATEGVSLALSQAITGAAPVAGGDYAIDASVSNGGPATATDVVLTETLPPNTTVVGVPVGCAAPSGGTMRCALPALPAGQSEGLQIVLSTSASGPISNHLSVTADQVDSNPAQESSTLDATVGVNPSTIVPGPGPGTPLNTPGPVLAESLRVNRVTGTVAARLPNGTAINISSFAIVPVGTRIDTTRGTALLTAAQPSGADITGDFYQGEFSATQAKSGAVTASLDQALPGCDAATNKHKATRLPATAARKKKPKKAKKTAANSTRHLWGHATGPFGINGLYGSSSVRGTEWEVIDGCQSTTIKVTKGLAYAAPIGRVTPAARLLKAGGKVVFRPKPR
jgi:hypothetical protein